MLERVVVDGKQFRCGATPFRWRGVTYGTFAPRADGARFPEPAVVAADFAAIAAAGFTVVRTYTAPPDDVVELAAAHGLRILAGIAYADWRHLLDGSARESNRVLRAAKREIAAAVRARAGDPTILAWCIGNEIPPDVVRWTGSRRIERILTALTTVVRREDPAALVTYASYPPTEHLRLDGLDFLTFNLFVEHHAALRRYLYRLHHLAGDRPVVVGELGIHVGSPEVPTTPAAELDQATRLGPQLQVMDECGVAGCCLFSWTDEWAVEGTDVAGWAFGLTAADRRPRPALAVAARWAHQGIEALVAEWPGISVVVCAYNAADTLEECLAATTALGYPELEVIVVDDGSTDATAAIARSFPTVRLVTIPHAGLSAARNAGAEAAVHGIVAYLDADAYPTPTWPYHLALAFTPEVVAAGGPNLPVPSDGLTAAAIAQAPGGPLPVLLADDRAEHLPGANLAVRREWLTALGGFDPIFTSAGDDVDLCWRLLDAGGEIAYHPAAVVWHHRRATLRGYLRQQRGYGRSESLVELRHPERYTATGSARWTGRVYGALVPARLRRRVYHGPFGTAPYQTAAEQPGHAMALVEQLGVPLGWFTLALAPLAVLWPAYGLAALVGLGLLLVVAGGAWQAAATPPGPWSARLRFRATVVVAQLTQPVVRLAGRFRPVVELREELDAPELPAFPTTHRGGVAVLETYLSREDLAERVLATLHRAGWRRDATTGWEPWDARFHASPLVRVELHVRARTPQYLLLLRLRRRVAWGRTLSALAAAALLAFLDWRAGAALAALTAATVAYGWYRAGRPLWRLLHDTETGPGAIDPTPS